MRTVREHLSRAMLAVVTATSTEDLCKKQHALSLPALCYPARDVRQHGPMGCCWIHGGDYLLHLPCITSSFPIFHPFASSLLGNKDLNCLERCLTSLLSPPHSGQNRYFSSTIHVDQDPPLGKICHLSHTECFQGDCSPSFGATELSCRLCLYHQQPQRILVCRI